MADGKQNGRSEAVSAAKKAKFHERNLAGMGANQPDDRARLLEVTVDSDLDAPTEGLRNLSAKDFPLANYDDLADTFEFKGIQEILALLDEVRHPHPDSVLQGAVREWAFDEPGEALQSRSTEEMIVSESYLLGTYSRATRGEDGFQQETSAKQTRESITVDEGGSASGGGGLRSKLPGL